MLHAEHIQKGKKTMDRLTLTENEELTILAVFHELVDKPYNELNCFLGSETIRRMCELHNRLYSRYIESTGGIEEAEECTD